jgi:UDP-N-acetylglucosamine--N-acetylmuramyl-(pentapeptide) pyrophosphoryl-undecaprenol N-acetylglucosamine transferase
LIANKRQPTADDRPLSVVSDQRPFTSSEQSPPLGQLPAICWVGSSGGVEEELVTRADIHFEGISAAGVRGKGALAMLAGLWTLSRGFRQARRLIKTFQPDVLLVTGGYVCVPVTLAARLAGVPIVIYLPDMRPGLAIKFLARVADRVAVTAPPVAGYFRSGQAVVTGYPVRRELFEGSQAEARTRLGLNAGDNGLPVLLVFGGSQGAHSINRAVSENIEALLEVAQVVHVSGLRDAEWTQAHRSSLPPSQQARYHCYAYLHEEMVDALLAADVVVSRAGASALGEFPAAGLPAVLVPYPYAGAHQWDNARYLVEAGAALAIADADLGTDLVPAVLNLLAHGQRRAAMRRAARALARPDAAQCIAALLAQLSSGRSR